MSIESLPSKRLTMAIRRCLVLCMLAWAISCSTADGVGAGEVNRGRELYQRMCVECHGANGEGVADKYDEVLFGDRSLDDLTDIIEKTMPDEHPEQCVGEEARAVAQYMFDSFYTAEARARNHPARVELARLTSSQHVQFVADLIGSFREPIRFEGQRGLDAKYYKSRGFNNDNKVIERVDARIDFQFAEGSPDVALIPPEEFSMRWSGSLLAEETGDYDLLVKTENGIRLYLNETETPLIDAWVSSGGEAKEHQVTVRLLGGRAYPLRLEYFKYKDKTASVSLQWRAPGRSLEVIPARHLASQGTSSSCVLTTAFPADDSSVGYARGTSVSEAWDTASTRAAIEAANYVVAHQASLSGIPLDAADRHLRLQEFCRRFASRAFRRSWDNQDGTDFVPAVFQATPDSDEALKRSLLLTLKSPWFLYVGIDPQRAVDESIAERLAIALWDSIPDEPLRDAAARGELHTVEQIRGQAARMLTDARSRFKLQAFFAHWLAMDEGRDISKDVATFPSFDEVLIGDLRTSLEMMIDDIVWRESGDYRQLLLADFIYMNRRLAKFYGAPELPADDEFTKVVYEPGRRAGVITHPYLLSTLAYHRSSSPIHRGVFLTRKILGRALKPPPMAIVFMDGKFDPTLTMREKVAELTKSDACQTCHSIINPLGFSLEHFDAVGRFRWQDKDKPIDTSSQYQTLQGDAVPLSTVRDLAVYAAQDADAQRGFVQQLFHHVVKQPVAAFGADSLEVLRTRFVDNDCRVRDLLIDIAVTYATFQTVAESQSVAAPEPNEGPPAASADSPVTSVVEDPKVQNDTTEPHESSNEEFRS